MPSPRTEARFAAMLAAVREAIEATSLRRVAGEIGLTPSGLQRMLEAGGSGRASTRAKIRRWYVRRSAVTGVTDTATARAALDILTAGVGEPRQRGLARTLLDSIEAVYRDAGAAVPNWLEELRSSD